MVPATMSIIPRRAFKFGAYDVGNLPIFRHFTTASLIFTPAIIVMVVAQALSMGW